MHIQKKYLKAITNLLIAVVFLVLLIFVGTRIFLFFMPFILGWVIALIANPLVRFFEEKLKVKRKAGSAIVIILVIAGIVAIAYLIISKIVNEVSGLLTDLPTLWNGIQTDLNNISKHATIIVNQMPKSTREQIQNINLQLQDFSTGIMDKIGSPTAEALGNFAKNIPAAVIAIIMCLLSAYTFVAEREFVISFIQKHIPKSVYEQWGIVKKSLSRSLGGYIKAQFKIEIWIYLFMAVGFLFLKVNYALIIALGIAILDILPFFGTGAVLIPWAIIKFLNTDYRMAIALLVIWGVGLITRQIIQPKIVGDSVGMPAIPTLILLYIGFKLGGVLGMIVAVPLGLVAYNMHEEGFFDTAKKSVLILICGVNSFRRLEEKDMEDVYRETRENNLMDQEPSAAQKEIEK